MYIGQTIRSVKRRWYEHLLEARLKDPNRYCTLDCAINKYGNDSFIVETIEECDDTMLNEREIYWIDYYNSFEHGYNMKPGGGTIRSEIDYESIKQLWNDGYVIRQISKSLKINPRVVSDSLQNIGITQEEIISRGRKSVGKSNGRKVVRISMDGNSYKIYDTLTDAAKDNNTTPTRIYNACRRKSITAAYCFWKYLDDDTTLDDLKSFCRYNAPKKVYQYTIDGDYVGEFDSMGRAAQSFGKYFIGSISDTCEGKNISAFGYRWSFEKVDKLPPARKRRFPTRQVTQIDKEGNIINIYNSIREAAKEVNLSEKTLWKVLRGKRKTAAGYRWEYYKLA